MQQGECFRKAMDTYPTVSCLCLHYHCPLTFKSYKSFHFMFFNIDHSILVSEMVCQSHLAPVTSKILTKQVQQCI